MTVSVFNIAASGDDGAAASGAQADYAAAACTSTDLVATEANTHRSLIATNYYINDGLQRWDTSSIPDTDAVDSATLRLYVSAKTDANGRSLVADWYDFGASLTCADWVHDSLNDAISGTTIASLTTGANNTFTLSNVSNISKTGFTGIRVHTSGGEPAGTNQVEYAFQDHATNDEPQLAVTHSVSITAGEMMTAVHPVFGSLQPLLIPVGVVAY